MGYIVTATVSFSLGTFLGALLVAMISVSGRADMRSTCLNEAQSPSEGTEEVKTTSSLSSVEKEEEEVHTVLEMIPKHEPIRKKDRRPHFKKCKRRKRK